MCGLLEEWSYNPSGHNKQKRVGEQIGVQSGVQRVVKTSRGMGITRQAVEL